MNYIVYDLEATCWEGDAATNKRQEVIEIGAVKVNDFGEVVGHFSHFIKPVAHPTLSVFCRNLTSITQKDVERAEEFEAVIEKFQDFIGYFDDEEYLLCSWGFFDRKALERDCDFHKVEKDWLEQHISLKHQYQELRNLSRPAGLKSTVEKEGFDWVGTHHRGIDDAINLTQIFIKFFDRWKR